MIISFIKSLFSYSKKNYLIIAILLLGIFLRFYQYYQFPIYGETADERAWSYLGASLIQERKPASWSYFAPYSEHNAVLDIGEESRMVSPALDHPPLFGLIPGFFHHLNNEWHQTPSVKAIRFPMIMLSAINLVLFMVYTSKILKNRQEKILALSIFALTTSFVFSSRLVVAENFLITLILLFFLRLEKLNQRFYKIDPILIVISTLSILSKISGLIIPATLVVIGLSNKNKKIIFTGFLGFVAGFGLFALWGNLFNWQLFLDVQLSQAGRDIGLSTFVNRYFLHPFLVSKFFIDGWILIGIISTISLAALKKIPKNLLYFVTLNWFFIAATAGERTFHGWYEYLSLPFLAIIIAIFFARLLRTKAYWVFALIWLFLVLSIRTMLLHLSLYESLSSWSIRMIYLLGLIPWFFSIKSEKAANLAVIILISLVLITNIVSVLHFDQVAYWQDDQFFSYR